MLGRVCVCDVQINYGGRVTDDNDRRLLMCILAQCYTPSVLTDTHSFSKSPAYMSPPASGDVASYLAHIRGLPAVDEPVVFGLSANAAISFNLQVGW
jgi:dynein heavy chain